MKHSDEFRTFKICVAYALDKDVREFDGGDFAALKQELYGRNLGPLFSEPEDGFSWPGFFLARRRMSQSWTVMFGTPPGVVFDPEGGDLTFTSLSGDFDSLCFVVPPDLGIHPGSAAPRSTASGTVREIFIAGRAEAEMERVSGVPAVAGRGLVGDRYEAGEGTFSKPGGRGYHLTLIESEAIERVNSGGIKLSVAEARRNVVTEGVRLDDLIGRRFVIGDVECIGRRRCEPCSHLQRLTPPGTLRALAHRGGLRADILTGGEIKTGDEVKAL